MSDMSQMQTGDVDNASNESCIDSDLTQYHLFFWFNSRSLVNGLSISLSKNLPDSSGLVGDLKLKQTELPTNGRDWPCQLILGMYIEIVDPCDACD